MSPARLFLLALIVALGNHPLTTQETKKIHIEPSTDHLDFMIGKDLVTRYHVGSNYAKPIFWPVLAPNGAALTRSWPMKQDASSETKDHPHQKSAWFCHGDVIPEGLEIKKRIGGVTGVDFWSEAPGHGNIVCTKVDMPKSGEGQAQVATHNEWRMADGTKIMDENRLLSLHDFGKARLVVINIDLVASVCPITFGDTKEGSMGIRINDQIRADKGKGKLQNADGKVGEKDCWGRKSPWTDYSGAIDGKQAGLALLDDPKNPFPACWHIRGYGLDAANPFGRAKAKFPGAAGKKVLVKLAKGEHLRLRYGMVLHDGDAAEGGVAEVYRQFVALRGKE
jgi:hypothetical protein